MSIPIGIVRTRRSVLLCAISLLGFVLPVALVGCGGDEAANPPVEVTPSEVTLLPSGTQQFAAGVMNDRNQAVKWSVQEGTSGGTISSSGYYTAPATVGTYHVIATSVAKPSWTGGATITVSTTAPTPSPSPTPTPAPAVSVSLTPTSSTLSISGTQTFTASVANATDQSVTWSVQEGSTGGTVTSAGVYTAPSTAGTYHVVATSVADSTATATATITVQSGGSTVTVD